MTELCLASTVARVLGISSEAVRVAADSGRLEVEARTVEGFRLFTPDAVERFRLFRDRRNASRTNESPARATTR